MPATERRSCCAAALAHSPLRLACSQTPHAALPRRHSKLTLRQSTLAGGASRPAGGALPGGGGERRASATLRRSAPNGMAAILRAVRRPGPTSGAGARLLQDLLAHLDVPLALAPEQHHHLRGPQGISTTTCAPHRVSALRMRREPPTEAGACQTAQSQPQSRGRRPAASAQGRRARSQ